jgi:Leucine-rich repeat (LRR) protein
MEYTWGVTNLSNLTEIQMLYPAKFPLIPATFLQRKLVQKQPSTNLNKKVCHSQICHTPEYTHLRTLPPETGVMRNLRILDLSHNEFLTSLPPELGKAPKLETIILSDTPLLSSLPKEITDNSRIKIIGKNYESLPWNPFADVQG